METLSRWVIVLVCVPMVLLTAACSTPTRTIVVDALADDSARYQRPSGQAMPYVLKPGEQGVSPDDLRYREFAGQVERGLAAQGYQRVDVADGAASANAVVVYLTYGVGTPRTVTRTYSSPIYGFTGGDRYHYSQTQIGPDGRTETRGHVYEDSEWDRVGTNVRSETATYYQLFMQLETFTPGASGAQERPIWSVEATSDGETNDLRRMFPDLLDAAVPWIGKSSPGQVRVEMKATENK